MEGTGHAGLDRGEWRDGGVCVRLVLLAHGTAFDIFSHKLCKAGPPEFRGDKLAGLEVTGVSSGLMVVAVGKDGAAERVPWGDIDTSFVGQNMVIVLSV